MAKLRNAERAYLRMAEESHDRRMAWWREARFGMFVHWGLYSQLGRHEWVMNRERIPVREYEKLAQTWRPKPRPAREWAQLARRAGMKYMVMTTKHQEGFLLWDSKMSDYNAAKCGPGRDLVREYVEACREFGLGVGFYYSLMDWHHPDGARCATDEAARQRFVAYIHGQIRELLTNYGKIDVLWYDVNWPLSPQGWESEKMNKLVFELQPDIIVNNRNGLPGDFSTPEQEIGAEKAGRAWETCMTMNDSWGYHVADDNWKSPKTVVRDLVSCAAGGGNYLLNIGPKADGSIPEESVRILSAVGKWMEKNGASIYPADRVNADDHNYCAYTRKGNTLYVQVYFWPGETVAIGGLRSKVRSARLLATGQEVRFEQSEVQVKFTGLPATAPDDPVTVLEVECDSEPVINSMDVRRKRKREQAGASFS